MLFHWFSSFPTLPLSMILSSVIYPVGRESILLSLLSQRKIPNSKDLPKPRPSSIVVYLSLLRRPSSFLDSSLRGSFLLAPMMAGTFFLVDGGRLLEILKRIRGRGWQRPRAHSFKNIKSASSRKQKHRNTH